MVTYSAIIKTMAEANIKAAEDFIGSFNSIEMELKRLYQRDERWISFSQLVVSLQRNHSVVRRYANDLLEFAELRNAIVHSRRDNSLIAYPMEATVLEIKNIAGAILRPPKVIPMFGRSVFTVNTQARLSEALSLMAKENISQIPVMTTNNVIVEVLNGNSIARWLSKQTTVSPADIIVESIIPEIEVKNNYKFINKFTSVFEAAEVYEKSLNKGWYADAIFINETGRNGQTLLGIIVLEDIAPYIS